MSISIMPETTAEEVAQNIRMILGTLKGSVLTDREFGLSATLIDRPMPVAMAAIRAEIFDAIEKYEPRARDPNIEFSQKADTMAGQLIPVVKFEVINEQS